MAICKTDAFVIRKFDFRETSIIVEFFSHDFGRIKGILKGIRGDAKKFGSKLDIFSLNHIVFYQSRGSEIHLVSQCDLIDGFFNIRQDLAKINLASFLMEMISVVMALEDKNEDVFKLILSCLRDLADTHDAHKILNIAQIKLLRLSGFKPHFDSCVLCDSEIEGYANFSTAFGGLLCPKCAYRDMNKHDILKGTVASIRHIEKSDWQDIRRLSLSSPVRMELKSMLDKFVTFHLEKRLKTVRFL